MRATRYLAFGIYEGRQAVDDGLWRGRLLVF
jgi:hypothetical protein